MLIGAGAPGRSIRASSTASLRARSTGQCLTPTRAVAANAWADVVLCEWAGANAVWRAHRKRPGQRLMVHLHRFELETAWPAAVDWRAVDRLVAVSPAYADILRTKLPAARVVAVPNCVDETALDRAKTPGARFHLGLLGAVPKRKRLDLALDLVTDVRRRDERFRLFVKSRMPWEGSARVTGLDLENLR